MSVPVVSVPVVPSDNGVQKPESQRLRWSKNFDRSKKMQIFEKKTPEKERKIDEKIKIWEKTRSFRKKNTGKETLAEKEKPGKHQIVFEILWVWDSYSTENYIFALHCVEPKVDRKPPKPTKFHNTAFQMFLEQDCDSSGGKNPPPPSQPNRRRLIFRNQKFAFVFKIVGRQHDKDRSSFYWYWLPHWIFSSSKSVGNEEKNDTRVKCLNRAVLGNIVVFTFYI